MKLTQDKTNFIKARAEGHSLRSAAEAIGISRSTAEKWDHALSVQIEKAKRDELEELEQTYCLTRAARLEALGQTLEKLKSSINELDFSKIPGDKLIPLYLRMLKELSRETYSAPQQITNMEPWSLEKVAVDLINQTAAGELAPDQSQATARAIVAASSIYETSVLQKKVDRLEVILTEIQQERNAK